jgi:hypothetical protein
MSLLGRQFGIEVVRRPAVAAAAAVQVLLLLLLTQTYI